MSKTTKFYRNLLNSFYAINTNYILATIFYDGQLSPTVRELSAREFLEIDIPYVYISLRERVRHEKRL